jgi:hypothetical protein
VRPWHPWKRSTTGHAEGPSRLEGSPPRPSFFGRRCFPAPGALLGPGAFIFEYSSRMAFSDEIVLEAWKRSRDRCECQREGHGHMSGRCGRLLMWALHGSVTSAGWDARRRTTWGTDVLWNCEIICAGCQKPPQPVRVR